MILLDTNELVWVAESASDAGVHRREFPPSKLLLLLLLLLSEEALGLKVREDPATAPRVTLGRPGVETDMIAGQ